MNEPVDTYQGAWLPEDEHSTAPSMTMRTALRTSSNRAAVRVLETVGIERAVSYARKLGVGTVPSVPSLALGSGEVTLASMTAAYAAFAHGGIVREPIFITRVEDQDGSVLFQSDSHPRRAVSETTAFLMATMLADVVDAGTANRARALGFTLPAAGKTGTTNDFVDAWFVGFTPSLVAGVWVGFDTPRTIIKNGFAGHLAVPMWARFMKAATKDDTPPHGSSRRAMSWPSRSAGSRAACPMRDAATPRRSARKARSRTSRWCTPTTSCAERSRIIRAPNMRRNTCLIRSRTFAASAFEAWIFSASHRDTDRCRVARDSAAPSAAARPGLPPAPADPSPAPSRLRRLAAEIAGAALPPPAPPERRRRTVRSASRTIIDN